MVVIIDYGIGNLRSMEKALAAVGAEVCRTDRPEEIRKGDKIVLPGVGAFGACADEIRRREGLEDVIHEVIDAGRPFLGVCVGMQLLFDIGEEMGVHQGLGVIPGHVVRFDAAAAVDAHAVAAESASGEAAEDGSNPAPGKMSSGEAASNDAAKSGAEAVSEAPELTREAWSGALKIPHMGWNTLHPHRPSPLLAGLDDGAYCYFVHSFICVPQEPDDILATTQYGVEFPSVVHRNNVYGVQFHPEKSQQNGLRILQNFAELA